jgi:hypothetical protein
MSFLAYVFLFFNVIAFDYADSNDLDQASRQAMEDTSKMLKDRNAREKEINKDSRAQYMDQHVKSVGGNAENTDAIYGLSADVMEELVQKTGGDPVKMMEILDKAKKDPEGFAKSLSPATQSKIRGLAGKVSNENTQLNKQPAK